MNDSVSTSHGLLTSSLFEVPGCTKLAVKQLKWANSYKSAVQQVLFICGFCFD